MCAFKDNMGFEEQLISAVQNNPIIYNKSLTSYKSANARENAWKQVSNELESKDIEGVKRRWRTLRDAFIKYYRVSKSGGKKRKWIYYDYMLFLIPHIELKDTSNCLQEESGATQDSQTEHFKFEDDFEDYNDVDNSQEGQETNLTSVESSNLNIPLDHCELKRQHILLNRQSQHNPIIDDKVELMGTPGNDPDEYFLLSCVPMLKRLCPRKNMLARMQIQQVLFNLEFGDSDNIQEDYNHSEISKIIKNEELS